MAQADYCQCSSVTYQLISACAACQDETWIPWSRWRFNCTDLNTSVGYWPLDLPPGTSVPAWAYMDPRSGDTFNVTVARTLIDVPESTYIGYPTAPISIVPSTTSQRPFVSTFTLLPSSSASPSGGGGSSNTGPIVGGVVGGVAVIAFVVGLFVYLWKKRHEGPVISPVSPIRPHDGRIDMAESESNHTRIQFYPQITVVAAVLNGVSNGKSDAKAIKSKNQYRRQKAKLKKSSRATSVTTDGDQTSVSGMETTDDEGLSDAHVEYVTETLDFQAGMEAFSDVFARFKLPADSGTSKDADASKGEVIYSDDDMMSDEGSDAENAAPKIVSKRKLAKMNRLSVAELKQLVKKPEVVEWTDVSASDPRLLIHLKSYRNTIPIPPHWSAKRDYLQGKRGIEKPPFQLPAFIADTGIATMRDAVKEKEASMSLKAKTRERVQPKMGKMDIDYQKLHDAFFKFQTKPPMTAFGQM
ncbi:hypothetical protein FRC02_001575 [Tulasnella sp. 418]|nr:hypothetical protein FRC02_001575 [Tulasnella sp. 418]